MNHRDLATLTRAFAPILREFVDGAVGPLVKRLDALETGRGEDALALAAVRREVGELGPRLEASILEALPKMPGAEEITVAVRAAAAEAVAEAVPAAVGKAVDALPPAKDGKSIDPAEVEAMVARAAEALPKPKDGASVTADDVRPMVEDLVSAAFATLPVPQNGKDADRDEIAALIVAEVGKAVSALPRPLDGKDADPEQIKAAVAAAVAGLPRPQDGKSVTAEDCREIIAECVRAAVAELPKPKDGDPGKDGVGLAGVLKDHEGAVVFTLTNGTVVKLGRVDGEPGKDGLGFDDLDIVHDGERGFTFRLVRGEQVKEFAFTVPMVLDRGVFKDGTAYVAGDGVTWGGSFWIAQAETQDKPGASDAWRLAVKKGRDGKDGEMKVPREPATVKLS